MHIVVSDYTPRESFTVGGTPSSGPFTLPAAFVVFDPSTDLKVYDDGVLLTYASVPSTATEWGWTGTLIDGGYQGGDVNLGATITSSTVVIVRDIPIARATDFPYPSESLDIEGVNTQLDMLFAIFQDRESRANRSLRQPDSDVEDLDELPVAASRANMYLGFDTDGQPTMLDAPADTTAVSSYMASALTAANEAALKAYINAEAGTDFAGIATANIFTAAQSVRVSGATNAFLLDRSDTHGDNVLVGNIEFRGRDSAGNTQGYAIIDARCVLDNAGAETGALEVRIGNAGTATQRLFVRTGVYTPNATGGDQGADTINASAIYDDGVQIRPEVLGTAVAMSGSSTTTYSSIPSGINWIEVSFDGLSNSSTDNVLVQIGDSGGLETTGYTSASSNDAGSDVSSTAGFIVSLSGTAANVLRGTLRLVRSTGNVWVSSHSGMLDQDEGIHGGGARTTLDSALDRVAILSTAGNTFDAGTVNVRYG